MFMNAYILFYIYDIFHCCFSVVCVVCVPVGLCVRKVAFLFIDILICYQLHWLYRSIHYWIVGKMSKKIVFISLICLFICH